MKLLACLALVTCCAYLPCLAGGLVYEDTNLLPALQQPFQWSQLLAPRAVTLLSFRLNGSNPLDWHLVNLCVHFVNGLLLWRIARRYMEGDIAVLMVALFWLHPLQTESVAYLSGRGELLATLGVLLVLSSTRWWTIALAGLVALSAKEASAIGVLLLIGWQSRRWLPLAIWSAVALTFAVALPSKLPLASWTWMADQVALAGTYSARLLWPLHQSVQAPLVQPAAGAAFVLGVSVLLAFRVTRLAGLWVLAALLPRIVLAQPLPIQPEPLHEHHFYGVLLGLVLTLGMAWSVPRKESLCYVAA